MQRVPTEEDSQCLGCGFAGLLFDGEECSRCGKVFDQAAFDEAVRELRALGRPEVGAAVCVQCSVKVHFRAGVRCPNCEGILMPDPSCLPAEAFFDARLPASEHVKSWLVELGVIVLKAVGGTVLGAVGYVATGMVHEGIITFGMLGGLAFAVENMRNLKVHQHAFSSARFQRAYERGKLPKRFVLFLRGFHSDQEIEFRKGHFISGVIDPSEEEKMLRDLPRGYEMVAIGAPRKGVRLGAKRIYCGNDRWKAVVQELISKAEFVIFRPGRGTFLDWELAQIKALIHPRRVAFALAGTTRGEAREFFEMNGDALGIRVKLPKFRRGDRVYLHFDETWSSRENAGMLKYEVLGALRVPRTLPAPPPLPADAVPPSSPGDREL